MTTAGNETTKPDERSSPALSSPDPSTSGSLHSASSEPASFRMVLVSFLAAGIGLVAGFVAYALYKLIGLFTNLALLGVDRISLQRRLDDIGRMNARAPEKT